MNQTGPSGGHVGGFHPGPGGVGIPPGGMRGVGQSQFTGFPHQQQQFQAMQQQKQVKLLYVQYIVYTCMSKYTGALST